MEIALKWLVAGYVANRCPLEAWMLDVPHSYIVDPFFSVFLLVIDCTVI